MAVFELSDVSGDVWPGARALSGRGHGFLAALKRLRVVRGSPEGQYPY